MKSIFKRFDLRVVMALVATMGCLVIFSDFLIFKFTYQSQLEGTRNQLKAIAQTTAHLIDPARLEEVPLNPDGIHTPAYEYIEDQLKRIRIANPQIKYIYTLKKVDSSNIWRFIVDAETENLADHSNPGDPYDAGRFPEMLKGYNEPAADKKIETDQWGPTLSGYAPIRNALGQPEAIIGVDIDGSNIAAIYQHAFKVAIAIFLIGIILAIILGLIISKRVLGPVNELIVGTRYISEGNLHHRVQVHGDDEIGELAGSFNNMARSLEESRHQLMDYFYDTVKALVLILEHKDRYTLGHSESVAEYSEKIARRMGIDPKTVEMFKKVTLLHDIGKVGVRDNVLQKPAQLTEEEWQNIKIHTVLGEQILKPFLHDLEMLSVIRNHHERQDGKGYPDGMSRQNIPLLVAIVTVADSYDAMTAERPYRKAMSQEKAIEQLELGRGSQFHPDVLDVFLKILSEEKSKKV